MQYHMLDLLTDEMQLVFSENPTGLTQIKISHSVPVDTETLPEYVEMPIHFCQQFRSLGLIAVMQEH